MFKLYILFYLFSVFSSDAQNSYSFQTFDKIVDAKGATVIELQSGVKTTGNGYDGNARWKLINNSNKTLYRISIMDRIYTLKNGDIKKLHAISLFEKIEPGEEKISLNDNINSLKNTGFFNDKNEIGIIKIRVAQPIIIFYLDPKGQEYSWEDGKDLAVNKIYTKYSTSEAYNFIFPNHRKINPGEITSQDVQQLDKMMSDIILRSCQMSYAEALQTTAVNPNRSMSRLIISILKKGVKGCDYDGDYKDVKIYKSVIDKVRVAYKSVYQIRLDQEKW